jgi:hypothetical protein
MPKKDSPCFKMKKGGGGMQDDVKRVNSRERKYYPANLENAENLPTQQDNLETTPTIKLSKKSCRIVSQHHLKMLQGIKVPTKNECFV